MDIKKTCLFYCSLILFIFSASVSAQQYSMITWNTALLDTPDILGIINFDQQCEGSTCRDLANKITRKIKYENPAIVNLQEVFEQVAIDELNARLSTRYPYRIWNKNSGLYTASKFPILNTYFEEFREETSWDKYKDKGFMVMTIELPERRVKVINTHLQAERDCTARHVRVYQLFQIRSYLDKLALNQPKIFSGDFNVDKDDGILGDCAPNIQSNLANDFAFTANYMTEYTALKHVMGMDIIHDILGTNLTQTSTNTGRVVDFFQSEYYEGKLTFTEMATLDQVYERLWCYINRRSRDIDNPTPICYSYELNDTNLQLDYIQEIKAKSDHNPVEAVFYVH